MKTQPSGIGSFLKLRSSQLTKEVKVPSYVSWACLYMAFTTNPTEDLEPHPGRPPEKSAEPEQGLPGGQLCELARAEDTQTLCKASLWPLLKHFQVTFSGKRKITFYFLLV